VIINLFLTFDSQKKSFNQIFMGKGDKKSRRGKINIGSTGVRRPRKKKGLKRIVTPKPEPKPVEIPVVIPVEVAPEVVQPVVHAVEKPVKKAAAKKSTAKKITEKAETEEPKPAKAKKKAAKPAENLFSEKPEGSE
jgi:30S ribosomal protein S31